MDGALGPSGVGPPLPLDYQIGDPNHASMAPSMGPYPNDIGFDQPVYGWRRFIEPGMAGLSALTSLIGLIAEVIVVAQSVYSSHISQMLYIGLRITFRGVQGFLRKDETNKATDTKTKTKTVSPDNDLLGRRALVFLIKRQNQANRAPANAIVQYYVPGTDVPTRAGAVGFVAVGHVLTACIFATMIWIQWKLYRKQLPSLLGNLRWAACFVAAFQCYTAFDLLGRR